MVELVEEIVQRLPKVQVHQEMANTHREGMKKKCARRRRAPKQKKKRGGQTAVVIVRWWRGEPRGEEWANVWLMDDTQGR